MAENQEQRPWFFNLINDGDEAVVRILHSNPNTIEIVDTHRIEVDGKRKRIRCNGDGCPLCANANNIDKRMYLHLYDYTDNKEKVWDRTDKILYQLNSLFESWNPLDSAVVKITRHGNEFPKYDVVPQNPMNYAPVDKELIDKPIAIRYSLKRKNEEIAEFITTGKFPERRAYIPKEEYAKMKAEEKTAFKNESAPVASAASQSGPFDGPFDTVSTNTNSQSQPSNTFDPFADSMIPHPRKV